MVGRAGFSKRAAARAVQDPGDRTRKPFSSDQDKTMTHAQTNFPSQPQAQNLTRLDRWVGLDDGSPMRFVELTQDMLKILKPEEIHKLTVANLTIMGQSEIGQITKVLPSNSKLRQPKALRPSTLKGLPYLGSCKIGEVLLREQGGQFVVNQIFMSNFEAEIDTGAEEDLFVGVSKEVSNRPRMFYGLNVIVDRVGQPVGFDLNSGRKGLVFQTRDKAEAIWHIAAAATNQSIEALRAKAKAR